MTDYLNNLNPAQRKAVENTEGPVMVIAGAGSGKTRVLTYRIAHLMKKGVDPFNILSLTFTNKAAKEMKERIGAVVGENEAKNIWMGTFHSVFAKILRTEAPLLGYPNNFTIYDAQDAQNVVKKCIDELQLDKDIYKPKQILGRISQFKNNLITVKAYYNNTELQEIDRGAMRPKMGEIYQKYVEKCFQSGAMDFDDLLLRTNEVLTRFPEVLAKYQERFKYIMVDEYQDTNHSQYLIVKALASRYENLCVVGDDAQSIYAFRGANIRNILNFQKDYKDAKLFPLEQNYRSTDTLVQAANNIISYNKEQLDKKVWTENQSGEKIDVYRALSDADEANYVASCIFEQMNQNQLKNKDFAILYRTNAQSRSFEEALRKRNLAYKIFGGLSFYQRKEIKDTVSYLRCLVNPSDDEALLRIINYPTRGIGKTTINKLVIVANQQKTPLYEVLKDINRLGPQIGLNNGTSTKLYNFHALLKRLQIDLERQTIFEVTQSIVNQTGIVKSFREDGTPEGISRLENIQELLNSIQGFVEEQQQLDEGDASLSNFLETVALTAATDANQEEEDDNKIALMTVHLAKGLEYPVVFIVGLEENLFPSMMSMSTRQELEEERRLFYVALTRAEKQAYLTYAVTRFRWGKIIDSEPSRFLEEINTEYLNWVNLRPQKSFNSSGLDSDIFGDSSQKKSNNNSYNKTNYYKKGRADKSPASKINNYKKTTAKNLKPVTQRNTGTTLEQVGKFKAGLRVSHDRFGDGTIKSLEGTQEDAKAIIAFDHSGEKKLILKFAKLNFI